jgi:hypothetical protein
MKRNRHVKVSGRAFFVCRAVTLVLFACALALPAAQSLASSHREAPFIATQPAVDGTDFYMFRSYEAGRDKYVTMIADYIPFQDPQGGPNFYKFDPTAVYAININNNGDGNAQISFQFHFQQTSKQQALTVGGMQVKIPLEYSGPISAVNPATLNVRETYTVQIVRSNGTSGAITNAVGNVTTFDKPIDNVGDKTFGGERGYEEYAEAQTYEVMIPGCDNGRLFVGQRKEPFYIAVGKIFDLFNLNPLGSPVNGNKNDLENKNISSIVVEVPIACLTAGGDPVIGGYTTASVPNQRVLNAAPTTSINDAASATGTLTQVSRLGMPLVNEVVIGLDDKDKFNASQPVDDPKNFAPYVTNPTLPALIQALFPTVKAPTNFPRTDLVAAFLTGIAGLNQPKNVVPAEMLRLNTSIPPTSRGKQNPLGVSKGDNAGFPNGRRPADDVVDLSLRVAMGALCVLTGPTDALKVGCKPADAPSGALPFTDGVRKYATDFQGEFPYLNTPIEGSPNN